MNPLIDIRRLDNTNFYLVGDHALPGGTKQRVLFDYLSASSSSEFVYASPRTGYAQVAIAYCARACGKRATIFTLPEMSYLSSKAKEYGAKIRYVGDNSSLHQARAAAKEYCLATGAELLPFGLEDDRLIRDLSDRIRQAWPAEYKPKRIWLAVGSGMILRALKLVWPTGVTFLCVQVGKCIYEDVLQQIGSYIIHIAPEEFWEGAVSPPPYPSVAGYDAKIWQFVQKYGRDGDFIWNVAKD